MTILNCCDNEMTIDHIEGSKVIFVCHKCREVDSLLTDDLEPYKEVLNAKQEYADGDKYYHDNFYVRGA